MSFVFMIKKKLTADTNSERINSPLSIVQIVLLYVLFTRLLSVMIAFFCATLQPDYFYILSEKINNFFFAGE